MTHRNRAARVKRRPRARLWVLGLIAASALLSGRADAALTVRYSLVNSWSSGFQGEFAVANSGPAPVTSWSLGFSLDAAIGDVWGATVAAHTGSAYVLSPVSWSAAIDPGGSVTVGFVAQRPGGAVVPADLSVTAGAAPSPMATTAAPTVSQPARTPTPTPNGQYLGYGPSIEPIFNYGQALQMAWVFFEAQRSGPLPRFDGDLPFFDPAAGARVHDGFLANRLPWRGDSDLSDGADVGLDLTGGWHDAGDHVKFGLPMAFAASHLAWGVLEFEDALRATGQLDHAHDNLRWVADYFVRAHPEPDVLYGQVGVGSVDHSIWGAPEVMPHERPAFRVDLAHPGPDLAAQTASALAAISLVFRSTEPAYAALLLRHAKELAEFAEATRAPETAIDRSLGRYSDSILDARSFYPSTAGAQDDLPWAAAWLYRATKDPVYLRRAEADYTRVADNTGHTAWTSVWDDVRYSLYILMAEIAADPEYARDSLITAADRRNGFFAYDAHARHFLDYWLSASNVQRTPGGMAWLSGWGSARYNTSTAFLALVYRRHLARLGGDPLAQQNYLNFAAEQVNYVLGDNPLGMSYMVGFGSIWSQTAHHRASHGSTTNDVAYPLLPRFVLHGGLAGGPRLDDSYTGDRNEFSLTEVANDINAGLNGALAGLVDAFGPAGNEPDANFPPPSPAIDELWVRARRVDQQPQTLGTQVEVTVVNETAYPPRATSGLVFRYFVDLSELAALGLGPADVTVETYRNEGAGAAPLRRWQNSADVYYVEGSFAGTALAPIGAQAKQKTIEFLVRLPWGKSGWNPANDPSYGGLGVGSAAKTTRIAVYDTTLPPGEQLVWGTEPVAGPPLLTPTVARTPTATATRPPTSTATRASGATPTAPPTATATRAPNPTATPASQLAAGVIVESSWQDGYCAVIAVTNRGTALARPRALGFVLSAAAPITQSWNGQVTRSGDRVAVVLPDWVQPLALGQTSRDFGFCAAGTRLPTDPTVLQAG